MHQKNWICFALAAAMIAAAGGFLVWLRSHQVLGEPGLSLALPQRVLDYQSESVEVTRDEVAALPKDTSFSRRLYTQIEGVRTNQLLLGIVLMGSDRTSIHKPQFCLTGQGWNITTSEQVSIPISGPRPYNLPVMKLTANRPGDWRALYLYWFVAPDCVTASHWERMWLMATHLLRTGVLQRWAYVSCFAICPPGGEESTYQRMRQFIASAAPQFQPPPGSAVAAAVPRPVAKR